LDVWPSATGTRHFHRNGISALIVTVIEDLISTLEEMSRPRKSRRWAHNLKWAKLHR